MYAELIKKIKIVYFQIFSLVSVQYMTASLDIWQFIDIWTKQSLTTCYCLPGWQTNWI